MSIKNSKTPSIMRNITPDPSRNSFTEKISRTVSKKPTVAESLSSKLSGIKSIGQTFSPAQGTTSPMQISPSDDGVMIVKVLLIVAVIAFLAYNAYLYFYEGTDIFQKFFGIVLFKTGEGRNTLKQFLRPKTLRSERISRIFFISISGGIAGQYNLAVCVGGFHLHYYSSS